MMATTKKPSKPAKKKDKAGIVTRGKRKEAVARASISKGNGTVRINSVALEAITNRYAKELIREPLLIAKDIAPQVNISVRVYGGGAMGQAQAARLAIARALVKYSNSEELKSKMLEYDRFLLAEDSRRVEPKKYLGPKSRARFQKSYR
jgi:small subunit ribosomal protein S9